MRLLIDLQSCQNGSRHRGIGRYSLGLAKALCRTAGEHQVYVLLSELFPDTIAEVTQALEPVLGSQRILCFRVPGPVDELAPENARRLQTAMWLREAAIADFAPDVLLITSLFEGATDNTVVSVGHIDSGAVTAAILYDLIPLLDPERYINWPPLKRWYFDKLASMRRCDLLLGISKSAAQEAIEHVGVPGQEVLAISTGIDETFVDARVTPEELQACRQRFGIRRPYLMHSGNIEPRKNFDGLIRAFGALPDKVRRSYQLLLSGRVSDDARRQLEAEAQRAGLLPGDLVLTGHVSDDELKALYAGCHLFVFPSLHEGFGLPPLEAMQFGVPAIGSNTTSVPEVIGRDDACFDPTSEAEITALMLRCLTDDAFMRDLRAHARVQARCFDWDDIARRAWRAFEDRLAWREQEAMGAANGAARPAPMPRAMCESFLLSQLAAPADAPPPNDQEMAEIAQCLAENELAVTCALARAHSKADVQQWRVEGPFDSSYSLAIVNRESARALKSLGHEVVLHSTEGPGDFEPQPAFLHDNPDLQAMHAGAKLSEAAQSDVQARNLYPPRVADMSGRLRILHHYAWEESLVPPAWVDDFNRHLSGITCVSEHVMKVLQDNGVTVPMAVVGNGVDHWEDVKAAPQRAWPGKRFRFLHVSSCFPRKGADTMLQAFGDVFTRADDVSLVIKTFPNPHNDIGLQLKALQATNANFPDVQLIEEDLDAGSLKSLYEHCHVLVAPSRAEGFGLPLAEAMLSGLPIITTAWSGQLDFCNEENSWLVDYRFAPARTHFELANSVWVDPVREALAQALRAAHGTPASRRREMARKGRETLLRHFRWKHVTARAIQATREWSARAPAAAPRTGWITTWNTRCGIATYSRHLIEAAPQPVFVLAPKDSGLVRADEAFVHRCWNASKQDSSFSELAHCIDDLELDQLVLQFNYGFFEFDGLREFLDGQMDAGRSVVVMLHASRDPAALAEHDPNWQLATVLPALQRCSRILVHSLADMNRLKDAGLAAQLTLFPHPLWAVEGDNSPLPQNAEPLIASFGFCLPHKGLAELLDAVHLLRKAGQPMRLLMLNAEHHDPSSAALATQLRAQIQTLQLQDVVDFRSTFVPDAEVTALLRQAQLIVYPYQATDESASGAIRHGMATSRPVLVTPIPIFDELGDAVFRTRGTDIAALSAGIDEALRSVSRRDKVAQRVDAAAARWRASHDLQLLARRLFGMLKALAHPAHPLDLHFDGSNRALRSAVGQVQGRHIATQSKAGHLLFGPYVALAPGRYIVQIEWTGVVPPGATVNISVTTASGASVLAEQQLPSGSAKELGNVIGLCFAQWSTVVNLEIQIEVDTAVDFVVQRLRIVKEGPVSDFPTRETIMA